MNKYSVFIDGQVGTTGLQITERLQTHDRIELVKISQAQRKNARKKRSVMNSADAVILCLPDEAAKESVSLIENPKVRVLDASTAHRTHTDWTYGLPELDAEQRGKIKTATFVSIPGCYPTGFVLAVAPLVTSGIIPRNYPVTIQAISGYSGGGRKLIEAYETREPFQKINEPWACRPYALNLEHKHLPEMRLYAGLENMPLFVPSVGDFYSGMVVMVPLHKHLLARNTSEDQILDLYTSRYENEAFINVRGVNPADLLDNSFLSPVACSGTNQLELMVFANSTQILLVARLDNLGKGASGAAVQNLNIMLGIQEDQGLT